MALRIHRQDLKKSFYDAHTEVKRRQSVRRQSYLSLSKLKDKDTGLVVKHLYLGIDLTNKWNLLALAMIPIEYMQLTSFTYSTKYRDPLITGGKQDGTSVNADAEISKVYGGWPAWALFIRVRS